MNLVVGLLGWIIIGALSGWIASKAMGADDKQGALSGILIGVAGALVGGFATQTFLRDLPGNSALVASFGVALVASCLGMHVWRDIPHHRAA